MKLKTKIALAAAGLFLVFSQVFSLWILWQTSRESLNTVIQYQWDWLADQAGSFRREVSGWKEENADMALVGSAIFRKYFDENTVLYDQEQELVNHTPYQFFLEGQKPYDGWTERGEMIGSGQEKNTFIGKTNGKRLLILRQEESPFVIVSYRDITYLDSEIKRQFLQGMGAALLLALGTLLLLQALLKRFLTPLYRLRDAAGVIAGGEYDRRVPVEGKDEIGEVSAAFNRMASRVEEHIVTLHGVNERQRQLLGSLSHELKTPMTAIQGYAETLQRVKLPWERQQKALSYIQQECQRLSRLSAKMLELVSLSGEHAGIGRERLNALRLAETVRSLTAGRLAQKELKLEIQIEEGAWIWGDQDLMVSFLVNLVDNAAKASSPGQTIRIRGREGEICVLDRGCGISQKDLQRVTEPFYMADKSRARKAGGAGLGLALCAQIARVCGGEFVLQSREGEGTCAGIRWETGDPNDYNLVTGGCGLGNRKGDMIETQSGSPVLSEGKAARRRGNILQGTEGERRAGSKTEDKAVGKWEESADEEQKGSGRDLVRRDPDRLCRDTGPAHRTGKGKQSEDVSGDG